MVPEPAFRNGQLIALPCTFVQFILLGGPYGLDASRFRSTRFRNSDGPDARGLHLFYEPPDDRADLAGAGHRQTGCRNPSVGNAGR